MEIPRLRPVRSYLHKLLKFYFVFIVDPITSLWCQLLFLAGHIHIDGTLLSWRAFWIVVVSTLGNEGTTQPHVV